LTLPWPAREGARPARAQGANVIIASDGRALAWLARKERSVITFFRADEGGRADDAGLVADTLRRALMAGTRRAYLIARVDGEEAERTPLGAALLQAGFQSTARGLLKRAPLRPRTPQSEAPAPVSEDGSDDENDD
jgi:hypothetical protein